MAVIHEANRKFDQKNIYTKWILPDDQPVANIILVHGIGEHCARYDHVTAFFADHHIAVYTFDQIGHGKSEGKRGAMTYDQTWGIINEIKAELIQKEPAIPVFLYGHSMGGAIVLSYAYRYPENLAGVIATAPAIGLANPTSGFMTAMARFLSKTFPNMTISNGLALDGLTHDKKIVELYQNDPLVHDKVSFKLAVDLIDKGNEILKSADKFPVPLLLLQGTEDKLVDPKATAQFAAHLNQNGTYKPIEGGYHELHNEPYKEEIFNIILQWINDRVNEPEKENV